MQSIDDIIRNRKSIFPGAYEDRPVEKEVLLKIMENANWAPSHKKTEPWRFKVFTGDARTTLSEYLGAHYKKNTPAESFSELKYSKAAEKPLLSGAVIAICMQRHEESNLPEWEEIAAVACAVQNMWLTCAAYGIGSYWSSPSAILNANEFLGLSDGERCLGLFYLGYEKTQPVTERKRGPVEDKIVWM